MPPFLAEHLFPWLSTYFLHSTLLLGAVLLVARLVRQPAAREVLWKGALVGALISTSLAGRVGRASLAAMTYPLPDRGGALITLDTTGPAAAPRGGRARPGSRSGSPPARVEPASTAGPGVGWIELATLAWLGAAAVLLLRLAGAHRSMCRLLRDRRPVVAADLRAMMRRLAASMARFGGVRLSRSDTLGSPVALARREICIPTRAEVEMTPGEQRGMLAHELAHLVRRDPGWLRAALVIERVLFFQPLNRIVRRRLQEDMEYLCDEMAARHTQEPRELARCLARVATWIDGERPPVLAAGMAVGGSSLVNRVERLLAPVGGDVAGGASRRLLLGMGVFLAALACVGPQVDPRREADEAVIGGQGAGGGDPIASIASDQVLALRIDTAAPGSPGLRYSLADASLPSLPELGELLAAQRLGEDAVIAIASGEGVGPDDLLAVLELVLAAGFDDITYVVGADGSRMVEARRTRAGAGERAPARGPGDLPEGLRWLFDEQVEEVLEEVEARSVEEVLEVGPETEVEVVERPVELLDLFERREQPVLIDDFFVARELVILGDLFDAREEPVAIDDFLVSRELVILGDLFDAREEALLIDVPVLREPRLLESLIEPREEPVTIEEHFEMAEPAFREADDVTGEIFEEVPVEYETADTDPIGRLRRRNVVLERELRQAGFRPRHRRYKEIKREIRANLERIELLEAERDQRDAADAADEVEEVEEVEETIEEVPADSPQHRIFVLDDGTVVGGRRVLYDPLRDGGLSEPRAVLSVWLEELAASMVTAPLSEAQPDMPLPDERLTIVAARRAPFRAVVKVMELCGRREVQIWRIDFATRSAPDGTTAVWLPKDLGIGVPASQRLQILARVHQSGGGSAPRKLSYDVGPVRVHQLRALRTRIEQLVPEREGWIATIDARSGVRYGEVLKLVRLVREVGFEQVTFVGPLPAEDR